MTTGEASLSAFNTALQKTAPDTDGSYNSFVPDKGDHEVTLEDIKITTGIEVSEWDDNGKPIKHPGIMIKFMYRLLDDPESPTSPRRFDGSPFFMPAEGPAAFTTNGGQKELGKTLGRLKGHFSKILNTEDVADYGQAVAEIQSQLQTESVLLKVKVERWTTQAGREKFNEFVSQNLSGTKAPF